ncbi:MAG: YbaB/EbfC family nucleoid-associated protein [bacterium]|nr:YbaB/EbfC family nucleoid-associated protein [bacterium]
MLKKFQDMGKLLKQAQEMKSSMAKVQQELKQTQIPVSSAGGKIKLVFDGELSVLSVSIDEELLDPRKKSTVESEFKKAVEDGIKKSKDIATKKLSEISAGMMPGQ